MKQIFKMTTFALSLFLFFSCKKDVDKPGDGNHQPPPPDTTRGSFQFVLSALPGEASTVTNLSAIITITNEQNDVTVADRKVKITFNGKYLSDTLMLSKGSYKVSKFLLVAANNVVRFATPLTGSAKANLVSTPLSLGINIQNKVHKDVAIQVAKVIAGDKAEDFGYPTGSFGNIQEGPNDPNAVIKIKVHPIIRIGNIDYDSIPVTLSLITWMQSGEVTNTTHILQPGRNELLLPKAATKYQLKISKWGTYGEMTLQRSDIQGGTVYSLGGNAPAKKLTEVLTYKLVGNDYAPETRDVYNYDGGNIKEILHYRKRANGTNYIAERETFHYIGGVLGIVKRFNEASTMIESTIFSYRNDGKVEKIIKAEGTDKTEARIQYTPLLGGTGISGNHRIAIQHSYNFRYYTTQYNMSIQGGTMVQSTKSTSHGNNETGNYQYDYSINPFAHLNIPDIFLSNYSKHNLVAQQKTYHADYPITEPYSFNYSYSAEGYPLELITKYKTYLTGQHASTIKTVFKY